MLWLSGWTTRCSRCRLPALLQILMCLRAGLRTVGERRRRWGWSSRPSRIGSGSCANIRSSPCAGSDARGNTPCAMSVWTLSSVTFSPTDPRSSAGAAEATDSDQRVGADSAAHHHHRSASTRPGHRAGRDHQAAAPPAGSRSRRAVCAAMRPSPPAPSHARQRRVSSAPTLEPVTSASPSRQGSLGSRSSVLHPDYRTPAGSQARRCPTRLTSHDPATTGAQALS